MDSARASAHVRLLEAKLGAVAAQQELADLLGAPATNPLPLTTDAPLVGAYRTYFETLYAGRVPPPRMRLIDRTLPIRREAIETHVAAVQAAASAVHAADESRAAGKSDLQLLLACEAELSFLRRSFLASVRDYNLDIGEYALTVADANVPTERVIGMLIRLKPTTPPGTSVVSPADNPLLAPALPRNATQGPAASPTSPGTTPAPSTPAKPNTPATPSGPATPGGPSTPNGTGVPGGAATQSGPSLPATPPPTTAPATITPSSNAPPTDTSPFGSK